MTKPRVSLHRRCFDAGWIYETWVCRGRGLSAFGATPAKSYVAWCEAMRHANKKY